MLDCRWIADNVGAFDAEMHTRLPAPCGEKIRTLDFDLRALIGEVEHLRRTRNDVAVHMGQARAKGDQEAQKVLAQEGTRLKSALEIEEKKLSLARKTLEDLLVALPNRPLPDVPEGKDETGNVCVRTFGEPKKLPFQPKPHEDIGKPLGLSLEAGVALSGARFVVLQGQMARLERALAQFMLDLHTEEFGYQEISPPYLVREDAFFGVGQLPKFAEDAFQTTDGRWLISTAEAPLVNLLAKKTWSSEDLPKRFVAYTPCFRSEAGAAGRDTHGMIRLHQFSKVELVSAVTPEEGVAEHERLTSHAEEVLKRLGLPYRVMLLCSGDMGFAAQKTYDLEVWFPSQKTYREISSCSLCGDFQARRMGARFKDARGRKGFVHTLNGSGLAVGRTLAALLENYQQEDGSVLVPSVLEPYVKKAYLKP